MTDQPKAFDLPAVEFRCEAATKGPWITQLGDGQYEEIWCDDSGNVVAIVEEVHTHSSEFIAHAHTDLPAACALVREMVELLQQAGMEEDDGPWWSRRNAVLAKVKTEA